MSPVCAEGRWLPMCYLLRCCHSPSGGALDTGEMLVVLTCSSFPSLDQYQLDKCAASCM